MQIEKALRLVPLIATLPLAGGLSACVVAPADKQILNGPYDTFKVAGLGSAPSAPITVEALNQKTMYWETIAETMTSSTEALKAGTWRNSPALYSFETPSPIAIAADPDPSSLCRWDRTCTIQPGESFAKIRVRQGDTLIPGADMAGWACFAEKGRTLDFYRAGYECGFSPVLTIRFTLKER